MPRYAKGTLEYKLYSDIKREAKAERTAAKMMQGVETRRNSKVSRAHRLEAGIAPTVEENKQLLSEWASRHRYMEAAEPEPEPGRFDKTAEMLFLLAFVVENNTDPQVLRTVAEELRLIGRGLKGM